MTEAATDDKPRPGLRQRKKARTRALLQEHALRLFRDQGYQQTTVEQIAEAAEVSPTTVYRYFPTKADLVIYDDLDERMIRAFRAQPSGLSAIEALRASIRVGFGSLADEELELQRERERLIRTEPELRGAMLDEVARTVREIVGLVAERANRPATDERVIALSGAVLGLGLTVWLTSDGEDWIHRYTDRIDAGMALLESGFKL